MLNTLQSSTSIRKWRENVKSMNSKDEAAVYLIDTNLQQEDNYFKLDPG